MIAKFHMKSGKILVANLTPTENKTATNVAAEWFETPFRPGADNLLRLENIIYDMSQVEAIEFI